MTVKHFPASVRALRAEPGRDEAGYTVNRAEDRHRRETMALRFALGLSEHARAELEGRVARGETLTPDELAQGFAADPAEARRLAAWLGAHGFTVTHIAADGSAVHAQASAGEVEKALGVHLVRVTHDGLTVTAASDAPSLPEEIGGAVSHIGGLQPFLRAHRHSRRAPPRAMARADAGDGGDPGPGPDGYTVAQILGAYGAAGLGLTGAGQEIAVLIDTFPADADMQVFWTANGQAPDLGRLVKINVGGGALPAPVNEETLDAQWTSGIAPGASVRIYAAGSLEFSALDRALDQILADAAARPALRQVSISLGLGETYMEGPDGEMAAEHEIFLRLAALGVNVFVSSGDAGSNPGRGGHDSTGQTQAEYGASDPAVVGVGGTSLALNADGTLAWEAAWPGSGGGESAVFPRPAWQAGGAVPAGAQRLVPDVALAADPDFGGMIVLNGAAGAIGGTSWATPVWAGFCALINEARAKAGKPSLGFLPPLIYPLAGSAAFRDVTSGSNGAWAAGAGYDMVTGIGAPVMSALAAALSA